MAKFDIKTVKPKFVVTTAPETKIDVSINRPIITAKNQKAYFKLKNTGGPKGEKGDPGTAATVTVGSTSTGAPGTSASVTNAGTSSAAVLNFVIPKGDKGDTGDTGATGSPGAAATVTVGTTTTGNPGTNASVTNSGTQSAAVLNFTIPRGAKGDAGDSATITVGTTTTGQPGTNASVTNSGTQSAAILNFTIPRGDKGDQGDPGTPGSPGAAATIAVGTTTTGNPGTNASVTNSGTSSAAVFNFTIPKGAKGDPGDPGTPGTAATIAVGSTQTGNPGTSASVVNSGTSSAAVLDFTIPRGAKGDPGDPGDPGSAATIAVGTVTTGLPGTSATVTNVGTSSAAVFDFTIPRGDKGEAGSGSGDMLAADYDPNGTVANAGGIVDYVTAHEPTKTSDLVNDGSDGSAAYLETDETAYKTASIPSGEVDSTSTATVFTATVPGITELRDGVCMWLNNTAVSSASGFTIDINGLGAKPVYSSQTAATAETTMFVKGRTFMFVYDSTRAAGGCWVLDRGYNSNDDVTAYNVRTNDTSLPTTQKFYRYRMLFTSADGTHYVPANTSTSTNATSARAVNQTPIDPFGSIRYYSSTSAVSAGARPGSSSLWQQYTFTLGYSFNRTGSALTMTEWKPVYLKCAPQSDGSAIMDADTPIVQDLPTTEDGKIYIFLGTTISPTGIALMLTHPIYYYKDGQIRLWTNPAATGGGGPTVVQTTGQSTTDVMSQKAVTDELGNKADTSSLATVATTGAYSDLTGTPTIPTKTSDLTNDGADNTSTYVEADELATVATSGLYSDLSGTPSLATVATSGDYGDLLNKPTIPTVNDATLTIQQNGTSLGTFTANASSNATIDVLAPKLTTLTGSVQLGDYHRTVVALCEVASSSSSSLNSWTSGKLVAHRNNGAYGLAVININIECKRSTLYFSNVSYLSNLALLSTTPNLDSDLGFRPCTFKYNNVYYGGIEFYISSSSAPTVVFTGVGNFDVFGLDYYSAAHGSTASTVLNSEVYNSINFTQWNKERGTWYN